MTVTYLITGCSRGLGLALASELSKSDNLIIATARGAPTPALDELIKSSSGRVKYVKLDTTDRESVAAAQKEVTSLLDGKGLDVLINNAGIINWMTEGIEAMDDLNETLNSNVTSAHNVTSAFLPLLKKGTQKKVINMTTSVGSIARAPTYSIMAVPSYKVSKAALNMLTVQYAQSFAGEGFTFLAVSPGWLRTDLGGASADLDVKTGAKAVLEVVHGHGKESNGKFLNIRVPGWEEREGLNQYDGKELPW